MAWSYGGDAEPAGPLPGSPYGHPGSLPDAAPRAAGEVAISGADEPVRAA
jgi:hypothetical protein